MKSLSVIVFVGAIALAGTGAYFSDTETSTGNTFTAGMIDLQIDSECSYNGWECVSGEWGYEHPDESTGWVSTGLPCACNWGLKDLTPDEMNPSDPTQVLVKGDRFFDFTDIKPGDSGENTISFHGTSNDAHLYATLTTVSDRDVTCVDPEIEAEGLGVCIEDGNTGAEGSGELDEETYFFMWKDNGEACGKNACDNIYDPLCGDVGIGGDYAGAASLIVGQKRYLGELPANTTSCIGVAWCVGIDFAMDPTTGDITCNGESVGNEAQTDTFVVGVEFEAVQTRHNPTP